MKRFVILLTLLLPAHLPAQVNSAIEKYDTDSLERLIPLRSGTALVDVWNNLAISYCYDKPPLCKTYASRARELAIELDYKKGIGDAERYTGLMHMYAGRYPEVVVHYYLALENYELIKDEHSLASLYYDFAILNFSTDNFAKAEDYGNKALELYLKKKTDGTTTGTLQEIARLHSGMGLLYRTTNRTAAAKDIYNWYLKIMVEEGFEITDQLVHYQQLARCYHELAMLDSALWYFKRTLDFPEENASIEALKMESLRSMGLVYYDMKKYPEAINCFRKVALEMEQKGFLMHSFKSYLRLGIIYSEKGDPEKGEAYYIKALANSAEMIRKRSYFRYDSLRYVVSFGSELFFPSSENVIREVIWMYQVMVTEKLFMFYRSRGDNDHAVEYLAMHSQAKDSLYILQRNKDLIEMQSKYETSRKEQQIAQLAEENLYQETKLVQSRIYMAGLGAMIIMLLIIGLLLIRQDKIRSRQDRLILEQKLLRSQMNPHFIFNSMASIQDFIIARDARSAANYLSRFARLIRNILDASLEETIPVTREIETIEHYLELQKVRLEDKFDFIITKDEETVDSGFRIPALLVQPFVENAIEHGIRHKQEKGLVKIDFRAAERWLTIRVEDNGVGRVKSREFEELKKKDHASVSTNLIRERLKILNKKSRRKITLDIIDLYDNAGMPSGTRVEIKIPVGS